MAFKIDHLRGGTRLRVRRAPKKQILKQNIFIMGGQNRNRDKILYKKKVKI